MKLVDEIARRGGDRGGGRHKKVGGGRTSVVSCGVRETEKSLLDKEASKRRMCRASLIYEYILAGLENAGRVAKKRF